MPSADAWSQHLKNGVELYADKNYSAAIDAFNKSIALNEHWNTYRGLVVTLSYRQLSAAIDAFNKSIALNEHWDNYQGLGWALSRKKLSAAIDEFNTSIALNEH